MDAAGSPTIGLDEQEGVICAFVRTRYRSRSTHREQWPAKPLTSGTSLDSDSSGANTSHSAPVPTFAVCGSLIAALLQGLEDDACQAPHWGYMISGEVVVTYTNGTEEACAGDDLFYWPPGHSVRVVNDAEVILFSPQREHSDVMDHMLRQIGG